MHSNLASPLEGALLLRSQALPSLAPSSKAVNAQSGQRRMLQVCAAAPNYPVPRWRTGNHRFPLASQQEHTDGAGGRSQFLGLG